MSIDPATAKAVLTITGKLYALLRERENAATKRLVESRNEQAFDWAAELAARDQERLAQLEAQAERIEELEAVLAVLIEDPQFYRVRQNYGYEAARESIDERQRMLAFAAAGSIAPGLTIVQVARVERTVRELDPDDLLLLNRLAGSTDAAAAFRVWEAFPPSGHILAASGCVHLSARDVSLFDSEMPAVQVLKVTDLGRWVLEVMSGYLRSVQTPRGTSR